MDSSDLSIDRTLSDLPAEGLTTGQAEWLLAISALQADLHLIEALHSGRQKVSSFYTERWRSLLSVVMNGVLLVVADGAMPGYQPRYERFPSAPSSEFCVARIVDLRVVLRGMVECLLSMRQVSHVVASDWLRVLDGAYGDVNRLKGGD